MNLVEDGPGVYILYGTQGLPNYVGQAARLRQRLLHHLSTGTVPAEKFSVEYTETRQQAVKREEELIREHGPRYNIVRA